MQVNPTIIIPVNDRAIKKPSFIVATVYEIFPGGESGMAIIAYVTDEINPRIFVTSIDSIIANDRFFQTIFIYLRIYIFL